MTPPADPPSAEDRRPRRFYADARAAPLETGGWTVTLDGRPLRTPAKAPFAAPEPVAAAAAAEWAAQGARIDPTTMPLTRAVNAAVDRIPPHRAAIVAEIAGYGGSDLLCYRADQPAGLVERQAAAWDPWLRWSAEALGAPLIAVAGILHEPQPPGSLAALRAAVEAEDALGLAALSELTALSGSLVLALAVRRGALDWASAWAASRVDETWQAEQWGRDAEAEAAAAVKQADFAAAARLSALIGLPA